MMKKALYLLLALVMILPLVSCSSSLATEAPVKTAPDEKKTEEKKEDVLKKSYGPYDYPEGFSAGFARVCVSPALEDFPVMTNGGADKSYGYYLKSDLYVTCVAVSDGENVALLYGFDMKFIDETFEKQGKKLLQDKFGIPADKADEAIAVFRSRYVPIGIFENRPYDGIRELLQKLQEKEYKLYIHNKLYVCMRNLKWW